jgi:hypothetical protein
MRPPGAPFSSGAIGAFLSIARPLLKPKSLLSSPICQAFRRRSRGRGVGFLGPRRGGQKRAILHLYEENMYNPWRRPSSKSRREMLCSDKRIRGKSMYINDISRQQFSKIASRRFESRMTLTGQGLVLGAWRRWTAKPFRSRRNKNGFGRFFRSPTGEDFAGGIRLLAPCGETLERRRQVSRCDSSGADGLAGYRRGRRLPPGAGGGAA